MLLDVPRVSLGSTGSRRIEKTVREQSKLILESHISSPAKNFVSRGWSSVDLEWGSESLLAGDKCWPRSVPTERRPGHDVCIGATSWLGCTALDDI